MGDNAQLQHDKTSLVGGNAQLQHDKTRLQSEKTRLETERDEARKEQTTAIHRARKQAQLECERFNHETHVLQAELRKAEGAKAKLEDECKEANDKCEQLKAALADAIADLQSVRLKPIP